MNEKEALEVLKKCVDREDRQQSYINWLEMCKRDLEEEVRRLKKGDFFQ